MFFLPSADLRVSDADRDAAVDFLNRHYAAGRLTSEELSSRVDAAYRARYDSQLDAITHDLPELPVADAGRARRGLRPVASAAAVAAVAVGTVAVAAAIPPELLTMLLGLGLPLLMMLVFTVAPLAVPVLAFLWIGRALGGGHAEQRRLPRGSGRLGPWEAEYRGRPR